MTYDPEKADDREQDPREVDCGKCHGLGHDPGDPDKDCRWCNGSGRDLDEECVEGDHLRQVGPWKWTYRAWTIIRRDTDPLQFWATDGHGGLIREESLEHCCAMVDTAEDRLDAARRRMHTIVGGPEDGE